MTDFIDQIAAADAAIFDALGDWLTVNDVTQIRALPEIENVEQLPGWQREMRLLVTEADSTKLAVGDSAKYRYRNYTIVSESPPLDGLVTLQLQSEGAR
ncbi:hypothetical protein L2750_14495 [Shewanella submarina]|uniref:Uncharacterized protein n=1 Tax=Shewanella submarina TaxID=2016376 RepID=A0ABV7G5P9_9GAMM|nr:hypothetical protein [Shewanella submarina]MCL1038340.1 hypothetical protein [Shewanella submarina]